MVSASSPTMRSDIERSLITPYKFPVGKIFAPGDKNIEFGPSPLIEEPKAPMPSTAEKEEKPKEPTERSLGRPKNARLSALASKRNASRAKKNSTASVKQVLADVPDVPDVASQPKKAYDLSGMDRLALSQNIAHMAQQLRDSWTPVQVEASDITALTHGLRCDADKPVLRMRKPSAGMQLLLTRKNARSRAFEIDLLHQGLWGRTIADEATLKPKRNSDRLTPFDFSSCPFEAVATAERLAEEAAKRKKYKAPKRLVASDGGIIKPQRKRPNLDMDVLSAKRLLKARVKEDSHRACRVLFCGPSGSGKSSVLASLLRVCDPAAFPDKAVVKVKWEAEKAGRPRDYLPWLVDELPAERRHGRSWDLTETSVSLPSGEPCHLMDCPGDQLGVLSDVAPNTDVFVFVVDATHVASSEPDWQHPLREQLQIIRERAERDSLPIFFLLNKMDRCDFSTVQANRAKSQCAALLADVFGKEAVFIPACAVTGDGLVPSGKLPRPDNGRVGFNASLLNCLDILKSNPPISCEPSPADRKPVVLRVRDVYENMGAGFTAVADVVQGLVVAGQSLVCLPSGASLTVRAVQVSRGGRLVSVKCGVPGELVHVVLWQVELSAVPRGSLICHAQLSPERSPDFAEDCAQVRRRFEARIETANLHGSSLFTGRQVMFHSFGVSVPGFIRRLLWVRPGSPNDAEVKLKPRAVSRSGVSVGLELVLESPHACIPALDIGMKFSLMTRDSLMATGVIAKLLEDAPALEAFRIHDCCDTKRLLFQRSGDYEQMEVD